jgi:protein TonB
MEPKTRRLVRTAFALAAFLLPANLVAHSSQDAPSGADTSKAAPLKPGGNPKKVYHVGGDVKSPRIISSPQPVLDKINEESAGKKAAFTGSTVLLVVIGEDGSVRSVKVAKSLNHDLDAKAIEAVRQWKYDPGTRKGVPVAVETAVEVTFHLHK